MSGEIAKLAQSKWVAIRVSWNQFPIAHDPLGIGASRGHLPAGINARKQLTDEALPAR